MRAFPGVKSVREMASFAVGASPDASAELGALFLKHGKAGLDHHLLYGHILGARRREELRVLHVGLGDHPGASLRAFRDFLPRSLLYGTDSDKRRLFEEERIKTHFVDQADTSTFEALALELGSTSFDLVIDDGLHSPDANLATLIFALKRIRSMGWIVIEGVRESSLPLWHVISTILPAGYARAVVSGQGGYLFVVQRH